MKKLFLIIGIFTCVIGYGQTPVDMDSIDATQAPTNAMYGLVFDNTAKKIYHMTMEYYLPFRYVPPLLYPSISANVLLGATTNPYSDKLYVNGSATITGNLYGMNRIYVGSDRSSYFYTIAGQLYFYSPVTGAKSLAQLSSGGGMDLTLVPNKSVILERADTAYGTASLSFNDTTLTVKSIGTGNMAIGELAGKKLTTGQYNVLLGYNAGSNITTGENNVMIGQQAGLSSGSVSLYNTYIGASAGRYGTGNNNVYIGYDAGYSNTGANNIVIGAGAGKVATGGVGSYSDQLIIDVPDFGVNNTRFNSLIWGDFANDSIRLNAKVRVKDSLFLDYINQRLQVLDLLLSQKARLLIQEF
jgi:hypothetical protein